MGRFRTGDEFEGVVCDFGMSGEGIVKDGAYPVFVPFAIVGEKVRVRIVHAKKDYAFGELIEVLTPSNERVKPRCLISDGAAGATCNTSRTICRRRSRGRPWSAP